MTQHRIHTAGQNNWHGRRPPISDADRIARHGPLQPMAEDLPVMDCRSLITGVAVTLFTLVTAVLLIVAFSEAPPRSPSVTTDARSPLPASPETVQATER